MVTSLPLASPRSETNSSTGDLGVGAGGRSPWDDPAGFIVVPAAYALAPGLGLPANVATLAVFVHRGRRLGQALHFHLLDLALADVLFTLTLLLWLTYYLGPTHWPFPEAACRAAGATYCVSTFAALTSVCRCGSVRPPGPAPLGLCPLHVRRRPAGRPGLRRTLAGRPARAAPPAGRRRSLPGARWASAGPAYATVAFFPATFLLVLAACVSLAWALGAASVPGPALAPAGPNWPGPWCSRTCWSLPSAWRPTACCWRPGWPGGRAPWAATTEGAGPPPRLRSCTPSAWCC
ncbi:transmembrane protein-like [Physeter macrocephalus]|uniref:Transmembrane protein-like n=1 Tax=Physeter macrocephalus TaxID=9755 RepID=A0A9W2WIN4_PHYMC|nr:transmembrane protein-like [Physeter catodon]XP_054939023.1 transmembrane protein-like [Physeter catodon]XP_054939029.1 transmembrane protein-like [Physeter catodon]XP_054939031.1 transmembrane protein-like [Physeter catodon]